MVSYCNLKIVVFPLRFPFNQKRTSPRPEAWASVCPWCTCGSPASRSWRRRRRRAERSQGVNPQRRPRCLKGAMSRRKDRNFIFGFGGYDWWDCVGCVCVCVPLFGLQRLRVIACAPGPHRARPGRSISRGTRTSATCPKFNLQPSRWQHHLSQLPVVPGEISLGFPELSKQMVLRLLA